MNYKIKKSLLGKENVLYSCGKCRRRLSSPLENAGKKDRCPDCQCAFVVPGGEVRKKRAAEQQRRQHELDKRNAELHREQAMQEKNEAELQQRINSVLLATGDLQEPYEILDTIMAFASTGSPGFLEKDRGNAAAAFVAVKQLMRQIAVSNGGDAVINCQFEHRFAVAGEGILSNQAVEMFCYGTLVRRLSKVTDYAIAEVCMAE
ncbi:hypothetical protein N9B20_01625 [Mariniblastus sp.]|nr:hypothetical protein [Mariniblastus sp.]